MNGLNDRVLKPRIKGLLGVTSLPYYEWPGHPMRRDLYAVSRMFSEASRNTGNAVVDDVLGVLAAHAARWFGEGPRSIGGRREARFGGRGLGSTCCDHVR